MAVDNHAIIDDHLAISAELVGVSREQVVRLLLGHSDLLAHSDLAALGCVVVSTIDLDQASSGLHAVLVVVAVDNHAIIDDHLAISAELVGVGREQVVRLLLGHSDLLAHSDLAALGCVVVIAIDLDQASSGLHAVLVVVTVDNHAIIDDHLAISAELVGVGREPVVRLLLGHIHLGTLRSRAVLGDVVVGSLVLDQACILGQHALHVVVQLAVLFHQFSGQECLAVLAEAVGARRQQVIGLLNQHFDVGHSAAVGINVVVARIDVDQASVLGQPAVLVVSQLAILIHQRSGQDRLAILAEAVDTGGQQTIGLLHILLGVLHSIAKLVDVVVGIVHLDQTSILGQDTVLVVGQIAMLINQLGRHDELAIRTDAVDTLGQDVASRHSVLGVDNSVTDTIDEVVILAVLDQVCTHSQAAVLVVRQVIAFIHQFSGHDGLAVLIEAIVAGSQQAIRLGDVMLCVSNSITISQDVVVVFANLHQTSVHIQAAILVVGQLVILGHDFRGHDGLAVLVEAVEASGRQVIGLDDIILRIGDELAALRSVVVVLADLDQTSSLLRACNVVVTVVDTLADDHLAVRSELVGIGREQTVGLRLGHFLLSAAHSRAVRSDVVVSALELNQTSVLVQLAVDVVVQLAVLLHHFSGQDRLAVLIEAVGTGREQTVGLGHVGFAINHSLAFSANIVVGAFEHDQASIVLAHAVVVVVVQDAILFDNGSLLDQMAVFIEVVVATLADQTVGADNLDTAANNRCRIGMVVVLHGTVTNVVKLALVLNDTSIVGLNTVLVVVQRTILVVDGGRHVDLTISTEAVHALRQQTIGCSLVDPVDLVAPSLTVAREVVVITIHKGNAALEGHGVLAFHLLLDVVEFGFDAVAFALMPVIIPPVQAFLGVADQLARRILAFGKLVPVFIGGMGFLNRRHTLLDVVCLEEVHRRLAVLVVQLTPALLVVERTVVVAPANVSTPPVAIQQTAVLEFVDGVEGLAFLVRDRNLQRTVLAAASAPVVEVPVTIVQGNPTLEDFTVLHVVVVDSSLLIGHCMLTSVGSLANVDASFVELVVQAVDQVDPNQVLVVDVVAEAAFLNDPAVLHGTIQRVGILEGGVGSGEVTAALALVRTLALVHVGVQVKRLLVLRLVREGIQRVRTHVHDVADVRSIDRLQRLLRPLLRRELQAGHDAHGVSRCHIDRSSLAPPVQLQRQRVGRFVKFLTS